MEHLRSASSCGVVGKVTVARSSRSAATLNRNIVCRSVTCRSGHQVAR